MSLGFGAQTRVRELFFGNFIGKEVTVGGWVRTIRSNSNFGFIELNDGSYFRNIQIIADSSLDVSEKDSLSFEDAMRVGVGACLSVTGRIEKSQGGKQPFELKAVKIIIEGACGNEYPLQKKRHGFDYLRTIAHIRPRANTFSAVFRIRSFAAYAIHKFFNERHFVYVHTPIITGSDCEGAGEMFRVTTLPIDGFRESIGIDGTATKDGPPDFSEDFFGKMAHLTVSGQLTVEPFALAFRDVYTFGPTFRAENSNTTTHAAEFWMIEPEIAFADLEDDIALAEDMLRYVVRYVLDEAQEELGFLNGFVDEGLVARLTAVACADFARVTYTEAVELLEKADVKFEFPVKWGIDLQTEHERYLTEALFKKPLFICDYPRDIKAFYMRVNDDGKTVAAADLIVPGIGELIGGSQREERYDVLTESINRRGLDPGDYGWYLDLRRYGGVKHAGFGMGFERCVMFLTGMKNIRDVIPYPRTVHNLTF